MKKVVCAGVILLCVLMIAGCAGFGKKPEKTAPELAQEGRKYFAAEKYEKAIDVYKRLTDWYPYSQFAKEAELRIADAHFELEQYEEALFAYGQYEQLHPSDPKIPYIIYRIGRCHYDRMEGIDRTQVPAQLALETFRRLKSRFPESEYAEKADPLIQDALTKMAGHEFYVGRFYFKSGHYKAAILRFENVISNYPADSGYHEEARKYLAEAKDGLQETPEPERSEPTAEEPAMIPDAR